MNYKCGFRPVPRGSQTFKFSILNSATLLIATNIGLIAALKPLVNRLGSQLTENKQ